MKGIGQLLKIRSEISYVVSEAFWREPQLKLLQKESFAFFSSKCALDIFNTKIYNEKSEDMNDIYIYTQL